MLSKLRQVPRLVQAARDNIKDPPGIFVKIGIETLRGVLRSSSAICRARSRRRRPAHARRPRGRVDRGGTRDHRSYVEYLETDLAPQGAGPRSGSARESFEQKLRLEEGIRLSADGCSRIAQRELAATQEEFRTVGRQAERRRSRRGVATREERAPGARAARRRGAQEQIERARRQFLERQKLVTLPAGEPVVVAPTPEFYRWAFASMWTPGPFETKPSRAYYYLTDVDRTLAAERQEEHLRDFNFPTLWSHLDARGLSRALPALPAPAPGRVEGAQVDVLRAGLVRRRLGALLRADDGGSRVPARANAAIELGQLQEALVRLVRFVVGIRLHAEDLSVEQGMRFFRDEAFLEEATARREAERGTFDPSYIVVYRSAS